MLLKDKAHRLVDDVQASASSPNVGQADLSAEQQPGQLPVPALYSDAAQSALPSIAPNTDALPAPAPETHPQLLRAPVFVPGSGKKSAGLKPPQGRRIVVSAGVAVLLVAILLGTLFAVLPTGNGQASGSLASLFIPQLSVKQSKNNTTALIAAQAATATAVMQDGYDAGGNVTYAGVNRDYSLGNGQSTLDITTGGSSTTVAAAGGQVSASQLVIRATPGQCTYWADYRYWQLTGYEVPWAGNASTYAYQAPSYGWMDVATPVLHSIIVLQPGVQHAGLYTGHVGIVERINSDGSVYVSSWNIVGPGILTYSTYYPGSGVSFVYHP